MSTRDLLDDLSARPGTSQVDRDDPRLAPEHAPLDDRDTAALLASARALAALVHFPAEPGEPADWKSWFPAGGRDELAAIAASADGRVAPHLALLIAAFRIGGSGAQRLLNGFTARQMRFQTEDVLGFRPRAARPDRAHLVVETKRGAPAIDVEAGRRFGAGKDARGVEHVYASVRSAVVNAANVERLCSIGRDGTGLRFAPFASSADGLGEPLTGLEPRWPPFTDALRPPAHVGFAIACPVLRAAEGARSVKVSLDLSGVATLDPTAISVSFRAHATGPKGWLGPFDVVARVVGETLELGFEIDASLPAVVDHDPAVHLQALPGGAPVVQFLLEPDAPLAFAAFDGVTVRAARVAIAVRGVKRLVIEGDGGTTDGKSAFLPFGAQPKVGSRLLVGSAEALSKRLTSLALQIRWQGRESADEAAVTAYASVSARIAFADASGERSPAEFRILDHVDGLTTLDLVGAAPAAAGRARNRHEALRTSGSIAARRYAILDRIAGRTRANAVSAKDDAPPAGAITVTLSHVPDSAAPPTSETPAAWLEHFALVRKREIPKIQDIAIDYAARSDDARVGDPQLGAFTDSDVKLFHVDAFGCSRVHAWLTSQKPWATGTACSLLPAHPDAGELLIGMSGVSPGDTASLLIQVAEGSASPDAQATPIRWSVLADDDWRALGPTEIGLDTTRGLRASGIVSVVLPRETSTEHARLPAGLVWLRASIAGDPRAACDLVGVHANAIEVEHQPAGADAERTARTLAARSITKQKTPAPEIKSIAQPYASFGGTVLESGPALARRAAERQRHRGRAITSWDVERLILESFPSIHRAKCIPHASDRSWLAAGHAKVVVVPDLGNRNAVDRLAPRVDLDTLEQIRELLRRRGGMGVVWHVVNPNYRPVRLDFRVRLRPGFGFNHSRALLDEALISRLSPWARGENAMLGFGGRVVRSALLDFVEQQPSVDFVTDFRMHVGDDPRDRSEAFGDTPDAIVVSASAHGIAEELDA